jgi:hypothetical protein
MRRAEASLRPSVSRIDAMMDDTAVVTNITAIKPAIRERVMYIIFVVLLAFRRLLDVVISPIERLGCFKGNRHPNFVQLPFQT